MPWLRALEPHLEPSPIPTSLQAPPAALVWSSQGQTYSGSGRLTSQHSRHLLSSCVSRVPSRAFLITGDASLGHLDQLEDLLMGGCSWGSSKLLKALLCLPTTLMLLSHSLRMSPRKAPIGPTIFQSCKRGSGKAREGRGSKHMN